MTLGAVRGPALKACARCSTDLPRDAARNRKYCESCSAPKSAPAKPEPGGTIFDRALAVFAGDRPTSTGQVREALDAEWPTTVDVLIRLTRRGELERLDTHLWRRRERGTR